MKMHLLTTIATLAVALSGCASIFQGKHQYISVDSIPQGAQCDLLRKGQHLASVATTPQIVTVTRTKDDILVTCHMAGYWDASQSLHSGVAGTTLGNVVLGGFVGWAIDSGNGSDNEYPYAVNLQMTANSGVPPNRRAQAN
jgi:hypothetical protein